MLNIKRPRRESALLGLIFCGAGAYLTWFLVHDAARAISVSRANGREEDRKARVFAVVSASSKGDLAEIDRSLKEVSRQDVQKSDALALAAFNGRSDAVKKLLDSGCDPNGPDGSADPLRSAVQWGFSDIVELLLKRGASPNPTDPRRTTPLFVAARRGDAASVALLLKAGARVNVVANPPRMRGRGGMAIAAPDGRPSAFRRPRRELKSEERVRGGTPLIQAVQFGYVDVVKLLMDAGADPDLPAPSGDTPRKTARRHGFHDIEALLKSKSTAK